MKKALCSVLLALFCIVSVLGCDDFSPKKPQGPTVVNEAKATEENHRRLSVQTPLPTLDRSLERDNVVRRINTINVQNKVGYVYLLGMNGGVVASYTVKGKVSSLNSLLTNGEQVMTVKIPGNGVEHDRNEGFVVEAPDLDGTYGKNPDGIFFFTVDGTYVEWVGQYLYADRPMKINTPLTLQASVDLEKRGN